MIVKTDKACYIVWEPKTGEWLRVRPPLELRADGDPNARL